jgi:hypothetical protein
MVFVSLDFVPPSELRAHDFVLRPLGPQYNDSDYLAWTSSIQHIRSTPDFRDSAWPNDHISLAQNLSDLVRHGDDFTKRVGFTYTVLDATESTVIGSCGLACRDEMPRSVAGGGRSCRSDQEPSLTIRSVAGIQPVTNG